MADPLHQGTSQEKPTILQSIIGKYKSLTIGFGVFAILIAGVIAAKKHDSPVPTQQAYADSVLAAEKKRSDQIRLLAPQIQEAKRQMREALAAKDYPKVIAIAHPWAGLKEPEISELRAPADKVMAERAKAQAITAAAQQKVQKEKEVVRDQEFAAVQYCMEAIKVSLHDPESAQFPEWQRSYSTKGKDGVIVTQIRVRAKNGFNATRSNVIECRGKFEGGAFQFQNMKTLQG